MSRITPKIKLTRKNRLLSVGLGLELGVCARLVVVNLGEIRRDEREFLYGATFTEISYAWDREVRLSAGDCLFATFTREYAVHEVFPAKVRLCSLRIVALRDGPVFVGLGCCHSNKPPLIAQKMLPLRKIAPVIMIALRLSQPPVIQNRHSKFTRARYCAALVFDSLIGQPPGESSRPRRLSQLPGWAAICKT